MLTAEGQLLKLGVSRQAGCVVVTLAGELDASSAPLLRSCLQDLLKTGPVAIVLELSELQFLDSSGLTELVIGHRDAQRVGGSVSLRQPQRSVRKVLEICGLAQIIPFEEAL